MSTIGERRATGRMSVALLVLVATLGGVAPGLSVAQSGADVRIAPAISGDTGVRAASQVVVSGTVPSGPVTDAELVAVEVSGTERYQQVPAERLNAPAGQNDYLRSDDGQLSGRLTLGCLFTAPSSGCPHGEVRRVRLDVVIDGQRHRSNLVRVDYVRPGYYTRPEYGSNTPDRARPLEQRPVHLVGNNRVRVRLSEAVRQANGEVGTDWRITNPDRTVVSVEGPTDGDCVDPAYAIPGADPWMPETGCTRTLVLSAPVGEDDQPTVTYVNSGTAGLRPGYTDYASNRELGIVGTTKTAFDIIRPVLPRIDAVNGAPTTGEEPRITSNRPELTVRLSNLLPTHKVWVEARAGSGVAATSGVAAGDSTAEVTLRLPADGVYQLVAVAEDPNGNRSEDAGKTPPLGRSDGSPNTVHYVLDTVPPAFLAAARQGRRDVVVSFTEDVVGDRGAQNEAAGTWTIDGRTVDDDRVSSTGSQRVLTHDQDFEDGAAHVVRWQPSGASTYRDAAGNALPAFEREILGLPPVPAPVLSAPVTETYTRQTSVTVSGTHTSDLQGLEVLVFDGDTGTVRQRGDVSGPEWSVDVPLAEDGRHTFQVALRHTESGSRSQRVRVADVVRDTRDPATDVTAPPRQVLPPGAVDQRPQYAVGDAIPVRWTSSDPAPGDPVAPDHTVGSVVHLAPDAGAEREVARKSHAAGEQRHDHQVTPAEFAEGQQRREATFRVETLDAAGNRGGGASGAVLMVRDIIGYQPVLTVAETTGTVIEARFPVRLEGTTTAADWRIDGAPPRSAVVTERDGRTVVVLTLAQGSDDRNAEFMVQYQPLLESARLRGRDKLDVSDRERESLDAIPPELTVVAPHPGPRKVTTRGEQVTGTTEASARANQIQVFRADAAGRPIGEVLRAAEATASGTWAVENLPVAPNTTNRYAVVAVDPAGNRSPVRAFVIVEDSVAPLVTVAAPRSGTVLGRNVPIRWSTADAHPSTVDLDYRLNGGPWYRVVTDADDDGAHDWALPEMVPPRAVVDLRVAATDRAANRGETVVQGLIVDFDPPEVVRAHATGERTIEVTFDEPVTVTTARGGFTIDGGPGVSTAQSDGATVTVTTTSDLRSSTPLLRYTGTGIADTAGGSPRPFELVAERGFAFRVTDLAGGVDATTGTASLSWVDDRNRPQDLARYEILREGALAASTPASSRHATVTGVSARTVIAVIAVDDLGHRSVPVEVVLDPSRPNITPAGGTVVSPDGEVVLLVPPGAVTEDHFGRLEPQPADAVVGYRPLGPAYRLVAQAADDGAVLTAFQRWSCLSFRPRSGLAESARTVVLRVLPGGVDEVPTRTGGHHATACLLATGVFFPAVTEGVTQRVAGTDPALGRDRFSTASALAQTAFARAPVVVVARADDYPDALGAASLAASLGAPVLLAMPDAVPPATSLEIRRLRAERAVLVGGQEALGSGVADQLRALGLDVERVAGSTRFETAVAVANAVAPQHARVYLTTGRGFADAVSASAPAARLGRPIFLTDPASLPGATLDGLRAAGVRDIDLLGGPSAVHESVRQRLVAEGFRVQRIAGQDRYATAVALARAVAQEELDLRRPMAASGVGDGVTSPDALAAGPIAALRGSPLLLVPPDRLHPDVRELLTRAERVDAIALAGGPAAIDPRVRRQLDASRAQ